MSMSRSTRRVLAALGLVAAVAFASVALAQTSAGYDLSWNRVGSGGRSTSASYVVTGSLGQAAVSPPQSTSAGYRLNGGFWYPMAPTATPAVQPTATATATPLPETYLPLITK